MVDVVDLALRQIVEFRDAASDLVFAGLAVLLDALEDVLGVATDVADGDLAVFGLALDDLDVFLATFLGELREDDADDMSVVGRVRTDVRVAQSVLDIAQGALVVGGHEDRAGLGRLERCQLLQRGRSTVVVDFDVGEQCGVGAAGADRREVVLREFDGFVHLLSGFGQCLFNHGSLFPSL